MWKKTYEKFVPLCVYSLLSCCVVQNADVILKNRCLCLNSLQYMAIEGQIVIYRV